MRAWPTQPGHKKPIGTLTTLLVQPLRFLNSRGANFIATRPLPRQSNSKHLDFLGELQ